MFEKMNSYITRLTLIISADLLPNEINTMFDEINQIMTDINTAICNEVEYGYERNLLDFI